LNPTTNLVSNQTERNVIPFKYGARVICNLYRNELVVNILSIAV